MFHDRSVNKKINKIHERAPRMVYKESYSSYEDLLKKTESVTIHQRNLKLLAIEIYKAQNNHNPSFMKQIFVMKGIPYHLRSCKNIFAPKPRTIGYSIESARFLGSRIWHALQSSVKKSRILNNFRGTIRNYDFGCNCRLCKLYLDNLDFL